MRSGSPFRLPVGDGTTAPAIVVENRGKLIDVACAVPGSDAVVRALCSRRSFLDLRWRYDAHGMDIAIPSTHAIGGVASGAAFERRVLRAAGGPAFLERLELRGHRARYPYADGMRAVRQDRFSPAVPTAQCHVLDVAGVAPDGAEIRTLPNLRALRIARAPERIALESIAMPSVTALTLEHVTVDDLSILSRWTQLQQLELRGFWQYNVRDVQWLASLPSLQRLTLDLGGRRKNMEVYRHLNVAAAWPFDLLLHTASIGES